MSEIEIKYCKPIYNPSQIGYAYNWLNDVYFPQMKTKTENILDDEFFFKYDTGKSGERLRKLLYRLDYLITGNGSYTNTKCKDETTIDEVCTKYSLDIINFDTARKFLEQLIDVANEINKGKISEFTPEEPFMKLYKVSEALNKYITGEIYYGDTEVTINDAGEKITVAGIFTEAEATRRARGVAMTQHYAAQAASLVENKDPERPVTPNNGANTGNSGESQFTSSKTVEETNTNTETTDTGKTDTDKSDDNSSPDKGKTEPTKDTDTKDSDKTFENKPKPDNPPTISDNKGSSGVSHGGLSSNNGKGNYTFTNSGISASQDEPIEILTDEKPGDDQITSLPDDNEDIYTIPTDLSGVTSTKKHSSDGGSGVIPILGGLGAATAVGVGAKIYMDNKKNNDNDEDSSESDDNTEDLNETSNENDGILADEWNEDDSNFEFDDSEPNMDDDESGFSEI